MTRERAVTGAVSSEFLNKFDQTLYQFETITPPPCKKTVSHFKGQLYLACAIVLNEQIEYFNNLCSDQEPFGELTSYAVALFLGAYSADISAQYWSAGGARKVIAGHMLKLLSPGIPDLDLDLFLERSEGAKLHKAVFRGQILTTKTSFLVQNSCLTNKAGLPSATEIAQHCPEYAARYASDLHMLVWLLGRYYSPGQILDLPFQLPWDGSSSSCDGNLSMNMSSFLYSVAYCVGWQGEGEKDKTGPLTPTLSAVLTTREQQAWWSVASKAMRGEKLRTAEERTLQEGVAVIRCTRVEELDIKLTMKLGSTHARLAVKMDSMHARVGKDKSAVKQVNEERAALYYKASGSIIERFENKGFEMLKLGGLALFQAAGNIPDQNHLVKMKKLADSYISYQMYKSRSPGPPEVHSGSIKRVEGLDDIVDYAAGVHYNLLASNDHHSWLFSAVFECRHEKLTSVGICNVYGIGGRVVQVPYFLLSTAWPYLKEIVAINSCCQDTVDIILPDVSFETIAVIKELVTTGQTRSDISEENI